MKARHELLQVTIGTFPEEDYAYLVVTSFSWILPLTIFLAALLDIGFVFLYMKKGHPWKCLLTDEEAEKARKSEKKRMNKEKKLKKNQSKPKNVMKRHFPSEFM